MTSTVDSDRLKEATDFIEQITGDSIDADKEDIQEKLKSGVVLCNFFNKLQPGTITKINTSRMPFMQMENIEAYITACRKIGIPDEYNFLTIDLFEGKNIGQVALNIVSVKRHFGHGFQKTNKNSAAPVLNLNEDAKQHQNYQSQQKLPSQPTLVQKEKDVKRTGAAKLPGHLEITTTHNNQLTCVVCAKLISGACVNAINQSWHPNCFTCKKCGVNLHRAKFYENDKKPYCERCILIVVPQQNVKAAVVDKGFTFKK
jgi:hypothetical protein